MFGRTTDVKKRSPYRQIIYALRVGGWGERRIDEWLDIMYTHQLRRSHTSAQASKNKYHNPSLYEVEYHIFKSLIRFGSHYCDYVFYVPDRSYLIFCLLF